MKPKTFYANKKIALALIVSRNLITNLYANVYA